MNSGQPADSPPSSGSPIGKRLTALYKTSAARDGALVIGAQGAAALIALLVDAFLFRKLPKADQGALSSGMALSAVLLQACDLGLALTTIRIGAKYIAENKHEKANALFRATLIARIVFAATAILGAVIFTRAIARDVLSMPDGNAVVVAGAAGVFGNAIVWWGVDVAQARRAFQSYAIQQIAAALAKALAVAMVAVFFVRQFSDAAPVSILMAMAVGNLCAGLFSLFMTASALKVPKDTEATRSEKGAADRFHLFEFGAFACAVSILTALSANSDVLLVQHFLKEEDTAVFACARRLAMALNLLATASITVLLPRAAALNSREACVAYLRKAIRAGGALAILTAGGLALAASVFVPIFGGPKYTASIPILQWLCVAHGIGIVLTPVTLVLYPLRREGFIVALSALQLGALLYFGAWWTPVYRLEGAAWAMIASKAIVAAATIFFLAWAFRRADAVSKSTSIP